MKKLTVLLITLVIMVNVTTVFAADLGVQIIEPIEGDSSRPRGSIDDMKINVPVEVEDFGTITPLVYEFVDTIDYEQGEWDRGGGKDGFFKSGTEADYIILKLDILNTTFSSIDYTNDVTVTVYYKDTYELNGFIYQINLDAGSYVKSNATKAIEPFYLGHYLFGCTLPNSIVNDQKSPLRMVINIGEVVLLIMKEL